MNRIIWILNKKFWTIPIPILPIPILTIPILTIPILYKLWTQNHTSIDKLNLINWPYVWNKSFPVINFTNGIIKSTIYKFGIGIDYSCLPPIPQLYQHPCTDIPQIIAHFTFSCRIHHFQHFIPKLVSTVKL